MDSKDLRDEPAQPVSKDEEDTSFMEEAKAKVMEKAEALMHEISKFGPAAERVLDDLIAKGKDIISRK